jgi:hypothetical protein
MKQFCRIKWIILVFAISCLSVVGVVIFVFLVLVAILIREIVEVRGRVALGESPLIDAALWKNFIFQKLKKR